MPTWVFLVALGMIGQPLLVDASTTGAESYGGEQKESMDSFLRSLFDLRIAKDQERPKIALSGLKKELPLQAPLAHPKAPTSDSFHLLKVSGAHAFADEPEQMMKGREKRKYEFVENLREDWGKEHS
jgi:hypothetical protein